MALEVITEEKELHPVVAVRMAMVRLNASPGWVAIHGDRTFEEGRVAQKQGEVFSIIKQRDIDGLVYSGFNGWIEKVAVELTVLSVRSYALGRMTEFDFVDSYNLIREIFLSRFSGMRVTDKNGNYIGTVSEIAFLDKVKYGVDTGTFSTLHHGMKMRVTYR